MVSFYPGPSKVDERVPLWTRKAHKAGLLSANHRSPEFEKLYRETVKILKKRLNIPLDYGVFFTSSATECWEIIAQSVFVGESCHFFNGAFGEKWFNYTKKLKSGARGYEFEPDNRPDFDQLSGNPELICLTQNETSNGTQVPYSDIVELHSAFPESLIAIDATSSMAGIRLPISAGDIWYASVQKCFGLPAGMAVMICSPRLIDRVKAQAENNHYNSLAFIIQNAERFQTSYTPNVLGIYLLGELMKSRQRISVVSETTNRRMASWVNLVSNHSSFDMLISNAQVRSDTVLVVKAPSGVVSEVHVKSLESGFVLGRGYGDLRDTTFRVANFPTLKDQEIERLKAFLKTHF